MVIWKYKIDNADCAIQMQKGAQILSVQNQRGTIYLWALVNPSIEKEERRFIVIGTGPTIEPEVVSRLKFVGTVQVDLFVWHVFERV